MSTKILLLSGEKEKMSYSLLNINSFYGGDNKGKCIQLTLDHDYIQLERADVIELVEQLTRWLEVK